MYLEYFGLSQPPFKITPDTNLFYAGGNRGAILEALIYAIKNGEGIVKVVGEVGTGKTMLCRMLEVELDENVEVVYLANPSVSPDQIPYAIAFELKLDIASSSNRLQVMNELQNYLLDKHRQNQQVVVFVEEAQSMPIASLEELRLLSNLETSQSKLLQIVLFGQPELDEMIASTEIRQLKERITYSFQLAPFKTPDIKEYLNARVRACGYRAGELFTAGCIREITRYSNGLLRRVNILADKSLLSAYATGNKQVKAEHVKTAARDSEFITGWHRYRWSIIFMAALILVVVTVLVARQSGMLLLPEPITTLQEAPPTMSEPAPEESFQSKIEPVAVHQEVDEPKPDKSVETAPVQESESTSGTGEISLSLKSDASLSPTIEAVTPEPEDVVEVQGDITVESSENEEKLIQVESYEDDKLLALENIIQQQDLGAVQYSEIELNMMLEQLEKIPSESIIKDSGKNGACENCSSLIYRPLYEKENL